MKIKNVYLALFILGITAGGRVTKVQAYDLEACAKDPLVEKPSVINLLAPVDQKMINCIPKLDTVASEWKSVADKITSAVGQVQLGNEGSTRVDKLEYNVLGNTVLLGASIQAKHTWSVNVPEIKENVPVTKFRMVKVPYPDVRWVDSCKRVFGRNVCVKTPQNFTNYRNERVPYVVMEMRVLRKANTIKEGASTTCNYEFTLNLNTMERKPVFGCGQGSLGNFKLDASVITNILNGEMPTVGSLINAVNLTPPGFIDKNDDQYAKTRDEIIAAHPDSIVYFSSESFVKWASVENHAGNIGAAVLTGGSFAPELVRQIEEKLVGELEFIGTFFSQQAVALGVEQIIGMMTRGEKLTLNGYEVSLKVVNTPNVMQKCIADRDECTPAIPSPRLGFAVILTKLGA